MRRVLWVVLAIVLPAAPAAHASPWLCTLPDGTKAFSYDPESAADRACVDQPISRGHVRRAPPERFISSPADFPRVDARTQKQRDVARRGILERELEEERRALAAAVQELAEMKQARAVPSLVRQYEQRIRTHRTNIANIEKELARAG